MVQSDAWERRLHGGDNLLRLLAVGAQQSFGDRLLVVLAPVADPAHAVESPIT